MSPFPPGAVVDGKYRIVRLLGQGGMGLVFEATHERLRRRVALKVILGAATPALRERFVREARAAARITHAHSVAVYDVGTTPEGMPYMVLELVEGESLAVLHARQVLSATEVLHLGGEIAAALSAAHDVAIVHRDVKPGNVLVTRAAGCAHAKVVDFGISKNLEESPPGSTLNSGVVGTPRYLAPEAIVGEPCGPPVDAYALGVTLYHLLTGRYPFEERPDVPYLLSVALGTPTPIAAFIRGLPAPYADAIMHCLARDPTQRPTLHQMAALLRHVPPLTTERYDGEPTIDDTSPVR